MYYIITLSTGQPLILYQEKENVYLYTISNGRINSKRLLFNDYKEKMIIYNNKYIFYQTINNQSIFSKISNGKFNKLFDLPYNTKIVSFNGDIFIFYINNDSLYCIKCSSFNKSTLLMKNITKFDASVVSDFILMEANDIFYRLNSDINLSKIDFKPNEIIDLRKKIKKKDEELSALNLKHDLLLKQYNEIENKVGRLQEELRYYKYL